jgi:hypothetical protein
MLRPMRAFFSGSRDGRWDAIRLGVAFLLGLAAPWASLRVPGLDYSAGGSGFWVASPLIGLAAGVASAFVASSVGGSWLGLVSAAVGVVVGAFPAVAALYYYAPWDAVILAGLQYAVLLTPPILVGLVPAYVATRSVIRVTRELTPAERARLGLAFVAGLATPLTTVYFIAGACRSTDFCPAPQLVFGPGIGLAAGVVAAVFASTIGAGWLGLGLAVAATVLGALPAVAAYGAWRAIVEVVVVLTPPILVALVPAYLVTRALMRMARSRPEGGLDAFY